MTQIGNGSFVLCQGPQSYANWTLGLLSVQIMPLFKMMDGMSNFPKLEAACAVVVYSVLQRSPVSDRPATL